MTSAVSPHRSLIEVQELAARLASSPKLLVVFDVRFDLAAPGAGLQSYRAGHIPSAQYLHLNQDLSGRTTGSNGRHPLPDRQRLAASLGYNGLSSTGQQQVVIYDDHASMFAARAWWLLRWLGYSQVAVLNGGLAAWCAAGLAIEIESTTFAPAQFIPSDSLMRSVDADTVLANLSQPDSLVIDARSPDRYRGENETLDPEAGHIPGARNRFFRDNLRADGRFKDAQQLRTELLGVLDGRSPARAIHQCGSGVTACHNVLAFEIAGLHHSALYPGSWSEWVANPERPIETGS